MQTQEKAGGFATFIKLLGSLMASFWLRIPWAYSAFLVFATADQVVGYLAARVRGEVKLAAFEVGLIKKVIVAILIGLADWGWDNVFAHLPGDASKIPIIGSIDPASGFAVFFVGTYILSIVQNCSSIGIQLPPFVNAPLEKLRQWMGLKPEVAAPEALPKPQAQ